MRKSKGLTQEELAWKADIELSQVSRIERGIINTTISQVFAIASALECSHSELFNFSLETEWNKAVNWFRGYQLNFFDWYGKNNPKTDHLRYEMKNRGVDQTVPHFQSSPIVQNRDSQKRAPS